MTCMNVLQMQSYNKIFISMHSWFHRVRYWLPPPRCSKFSFMILQSFRFAAGVLIMVTTVHATIYTSQASCVSVEYTNFARFKPSSAMWIVVPTEHSGPLTKSHDPPILHLIQWWCSTVPGVSYGNSPYDVPFDKCCRHHTMWHSNNRPSMTYCYQSNTRGGSDFVSWYVPP